MTTAIQAYAFGNCTYYVATRFPNIYPFLGNAKDWIVNAKLRGYPILSKPAVDTVVVYGPGNGYSSLGHVAVVDKVNSDGSFQVTEMNYAGYDLVDHRRSTMKGVIGFVVPPGSSYVPPLNTVTNAVTVPGCVIHFDGLKNVPMIGTTICMDGVVGVVAMLGGGLIILSGVAVFVAFALKNSGLANNIPLAGGPVGILASYAAKTSAPKPKPQQPSPEEGKAASEARVAKAKARLSPETQAQVDAAKAGKGRRLTPEATAELNAQRSKAA